MPRRLVFTILLGVLLAVSIGAQQPRPYRILITNDDGVRAPGLAAVAQVLQAIGEVVIVAPSEVQSGASHSLTSRTPIFRENLTLPNGLSAVGLSATPATTVSVAVSNILNPRPDMIVSGINRGYNLGFSAYLSGTVGAARQGAILGIPSIAASLAEAGSAQDLVFAAEEVLGVARRAKQFGMPANTFINVNVPPMPDGGYKGYRLTSQAQMRGGVETFAEMKHPSGRTLYWSIYREGVRAVEGTDIWAVENGYVAVTPLTLGEYDATVTDSLKGWFQ